MCKKKIYEFFNNDLQGDVNPIKIEAQEILQKESLRYLGSIISKDWIEDDVEHRTRFRQLKWRLASKVLFGQHIEKIEGKNIQDNDYSSYDLWSKTLAIKKQPLQKWV